MANLKDTIVLGNLTVTGKVVASDILVSGTGNEFDIIKVNSIYGNTTDIEIQDPVTTNSSLSATGGIYVNYIENLDGNLEISSGSELLLHVGEGCSISANSNIDLISDGNTLTISGDTVVPDGVVQLGTSQKFFDCAYISSINTSWIGSVDNASTITIGSSTDSLQVNSGTVQFENSITTPGISYGGTLALEGEAGTTVKSNLSPSGDSGTVGLGSATSMWASVTAKQYIAGKQDYNGSIPDSTNMTPGSAGQVLTSGGASGNSYWKGIYAHNLTIIETDGNNSSRYQCTLITNSSTALNSNPNVSEFSRVLYNRGFTTSSNCLPATGVHAGYGRVIGIYGTHSTSSNKNSFGIVYVNSSNQVTTTTVTPPCNIQDMVCTL